MKALLAKKMAKAKYVLLSIPSVLLPSYPFLSIPIPDNPLMPGGAATRFDAQSHLVLLRGPVPLGALQLCLIMNYDTAQSVMGY